MAAHSGNVRQRTSFSPPPTRRKPGMAPHNTNPVNSFRVCMQQSLNTAGPYMQLPVVCRRAPASAQLPAHIPSPHALCRKRQLRRHTMQLPVACRHTPASAQVPPHIPSPCGSTHLERAHECLVNAHHGACVFKLPTVVWRAEDGDQLPLCKELITLLHNLSTQGSSSQHVQQ